MRAWPTKLTFNERAAELCNIHARVADYAREGATVSHQEPRETSARAILVEIRDQAPSLQPSERLVAALFLRDPGTASTLSIAQMAQRCWVSTTSVVRFC